jgi:hypothetical protein
MPRRGSKGSRPGAARGRGRGSLPQARVRRTEMTSMVAAGQLPGRSCTPAAVTLTSTGSSGRLRARATGATSSEPGKAAFIAAAHHQCACASGSSVEGQKRCGAGSRAGGVGGGAGDRVEGKRRLCVFQTCGGFEGCWRRSGPRGNQQVVWGGSSTGLTGIPGWWGR